jgi:hypothetical protein
MKLQDQVCTLEQAKKLSELGINQKSLFYYTQDNTPLNSNLATWGYRQENMPVYVKYLRQSDISTSDLFFEYSAFTVAELGMMLPSETLTIRRGSEYLEFPNWEWENEGQQKGWGCFDTEASARADHLIMLLENNLIKVKEVNERLK